MLPRRAKALIIGWRLPISCAAPASARYSRWRENHATTIAGYVIHEAQTIPEAGQTFKFGEFKFEVLQKRRNQLTLLRITAPETVEAAAI